MSGDEFSTITLAPTDWTLKVGDDDPVPVSEFAQETEAIYLRSWSAVQPDKSWSHTDSSGHRHVWTSKGWKDWREQFEIDTLVKSYEHVPCDGSCADGWCEGYDVPVWHCSECGEQVEPGFEPDYEARGRGRPIPGMTRMTLEVSDVSPSMTSSPASWMPAVLRESDGSERRGEVTVMGWKIRDREASATLQWRPADV